MLWLLWKPKKFRFKKTEFFPKTYVLIRKSERVREVDRVSTTPRRSRAPSAPRPPRSTPCEMSIAREDSSVRGFLVKMAAVSVKSSGLFHLWRRPFLLPFHKCHFLLIFFFLVFFSLVAPRERVFTSCLQRERFFFVARSNCSSRGADAVPYPSTYAALDLHAPLAKSRKRMIWVYSVLLRNWPTGPGTMVSRMTSSPLRRYGPGFLLQEFARASGMLKRKEKRKGEGEKRTGD